MKTFDDKFSFGKLATCRVLSFPQHVDVARPFHIPPASKGVGSGFFVECNTYDPRLRLILSCYHVVAGSSHVEIELPTHGRDRFEAKIISVLPDHDLAVLSVKLPDSVLQQTLALRVGSSDALRPGVKVEAYGFPLGAKSLKHSDGVFAGLSDGGMLQTTAPISPGNSGGPLVHDGRAVGVVSAKIVSMEAANVGFAVPMALYKMYAWKMIVERVPIVLKPMLGICVQRVPPGVRDGGGVMIVRVHQSSPLFEKVQPGDVITSFSWANSRGDRSVFEIDAFGESHCDWSTSKLEVMEILERAPLEEDVQFAVVGRNGEAPKAVEARRTVELRTGIFRRIV